MVFSSDPSISPGVSRKKCVIGSKSCLLETSASVDKKENCLSEEMKEQRLSLLEDVEQKPLIVVVVVEVVESGFGPVNGTMQSGSGGRMGGKTTIGDPVR